MVINDLENLEKVPADPDEKVRWKEDIEDEAAADVENEVLNSSSFGPK